MAVGVSYIPDPPDRSTAFEPLLDELAAVFCPGQDLDARPEGRVESRYVRCEVKRLAVSRAAGRDLPLVRAHVSLMQRAVVHDQCRSGIRQLVDPLVAALGYRRVHEALIGYLERGSEAEMIGATMAWYPATPTLRYTGSGWKRREPTAASKAQREAVADLRHRFRYACLRAFVTHDSPELRFVLSLWFTLDPADYPAELQPNSGRPSASSWLTRPAMNGSCTRSRNRPSPAD
jgi:hypothetical protein